ncbi:MAG: ChaN family lipoprotein [Burkholderiales bacterium]
MNIRAGFAGLALALAPLAAWATGAVLPAMPDALAAAMHGRAIVLLGEVHDNAAQHALRLAALEKLVAGGARPALAFEQFDREHQPAIDAARRERPRDAGHVIAQGKGAPSWRWELYRPFVQLALDHDLPIVAANLSRAEAMKLALAGSPSGLPELPAAFVRAHEQAIAKGHCDLLPADALPGMAAAQIARDRTLAASIRPHAARGVVLLTGNGHARADVGVPFWLTADERARAVSIGVLERDGVGWGGDVATYFDAIVITDRAERPDPCEELRQRYRK